MLGRTKADRFESYPMPHYAGQTFNKLCELFRIARKVLWVYYGGEGGGSDTPVQRANLEFAEQMFRELLGWSASVPLEAVRADENMHHTVVLHTYFHCLVLDIFRPFLDKTTNPPLVSFEACHHKGDADVVYRASVDQLKRLVLFYLVKFDSTTHSALWRPALIYALNALIRDARLSPKRTRSREWMFYFRVCMFGLSKQLPCYHITDKVVRGIFSMAVRDQVVSRTEATKMLNEMRREAGTKDQAEVDDMITNDGKGSFIIDLDLALLDPPAAIVDVLVDQFDNLAMPATPPRW